MKYVLCVGVIAGFSYIGICIRNHLSKRELFYTSLISFIEQFVINVNFIQLNFIECLDRECEKNNELSKVFSYFKDVYINGNKRQVLKHQYLSEKELLDVFDCLNSIGATDCENQIVILQGFKIRFEQKREECKVLNTKYSGLAVKMSILTGCLVVLLLL